MIERKSSREVAKQALAGRIVAETLMVLRDQAKVGTTTRDLDRAAERHIKKSGAAPTFKGYRGFPGSICASPNDMIVHGIPGDYALRDGDLLSLDVGVTYRGFVGDSAVTLPIGSVDEERKHLLRTCQEALRRMVDACRSGGRLSDLGYVCQTLVEKEGFAVVRQLVGHGVGRRMHEDPQIPNYGPPGRGPLLQEGMVFAIEPMITAGAWQIRVADDEWSIFTDDGSLAAHFEHTVAITANGPRVLSVLDDGSSIVDEPIP